jgi:hypothetical protein
MRKTLVALILAFATNAAAVIPDSGWYWNAASQDAVSASRSRQHPLLGRLHL